MTIPGFRERSRLALERTSVRRAVAVAGDGTVAATRARMAEVDGEELRRRGEAIRAGSIARLDDHLAVLRSSLVRNGATVHDAGSGADARRIVCEIAARAGRRVVKSKSMTTEEVELNAALDAAGLTVDETDLGEWVVQLDGDRPSHVIAPVIHKNREEIRQVLSRRAGRELPDDPEAMTAFARATLREAFLAADVGISGVNFAAADTGTLCLVSNEGNARLTTSLPRVHIALMGVERVVPRFEDLAVLLPLLCAAGTGQRISSYVSLIDGPRRPGEPDGPDEVHVVLLDNGRRAIAGGEFAEVLRCIRCGACQNICPVYRQVGGHAYGGVYSGPIGAVLDPLLRGPAVAGELSKASSLCGACDAICPVRIPLHDLLLRGRAAAVRERRGGRAERAAFAAWSLLWSHPTGYRLTARLGRWAPRWGPLARWCDGRDLPPGAGGRP
jgi:L-lactate dehydrogenase complex protein LldF